MRPRARLTFFAWWPILSLMTAILLSGGMDSTTLLWWLKTRQQGPIHAISIDYGQRHHVELECAARLARCAEVAAHETLALDLAALGGNPLTDPALDVPTAESKRQRDTVVPFRNMLFATLAAAYCATKGITDLYMAPVKDDYAAYRDCRRPFYESLEQSLRLGAADDAPWAIHVPLSSCGSGTSWPSGSNSAFRTGKPTPAMRACGRPAACATPAASGLWLLRRTELATLWRMPLVSRRCDRPDASRRARRAPAGVE